ncbi:MAG: DNA polymerase III subunit alpha [Vibrio splendidus]
METIKHYLGGKSHFSLGESIIAPKDLVNDVAAYEYEALTVVDTNSINSLVQTFQTAKAQDIKAIVGSTVRVVDDIEWRKAARGEPRKKPNPFFMPKLIIKNDEGLKDLIALLSLANDENHFYYLPQVNLEELIAALSKGNLLMLTGDIHSLFAHKNYKDILSAITSSISSAAIRYELIPADTAYFDRVNELVAHSALESDDIQCVISRPVLYSKGQDAVRNTMNCIIDRKEVDALFRLEPATSNLYVLPQHDLQEEIKQSMSRMALRGIDTNDAAFLYNQAIIATNNLADESVYEWHKLDICLPHMSENSFYDLISLAKKGWDERLKQKTLGYMPSKEQLPEYHERLKYELSVLKKMGFEDYFLLVKKVVAWSRESGIMTGPARGSAAGSLVAFLIGITDIDPIRFGLIFERFINPSRIDLPDVDLDFMSSRREEVIEWLREEYGDENVCGISNYGELGTSSALRSVAKAHGLKEYEIECSKQVPKAHGNSATLEESAEQVPAIQKFAEDNETIFKEACQLQGKFRNYGQHAAGIVVAGEAIKNRAVVERRAGGHVSNWDKRTIEDWGLIKLDILGLSTLDVLRIGAELVHEQTGKKIDYLKLPLDDEKVLKSFGEGDTTATFQFESGGMRRLLKDLATESDLTFDDIAAATALYRPGPMESGMMDDYVDVAKGFKEPEYLHKDLEEATKDTNGILLYQEQVMKASQILAGFSMAEADHLRKVMGKKDPAKMAAMREEFIKRCESTKGMSDLSAGLIFDKIEKFAGYGFNKSHSIAYTVISYWTQWLKINHPEAFYAASLTILKEEKYPSIVRDANKRGILILPPDINKSSGRFEIGYDVKRETTVLYTPFDKIKGLSGKALGSIMEAREKIGEFASKEEFLGLVNKRSVNKRVQENLELVGAFANVEEQLPPLHPDRLKSQKVLLPGLVVENVKADRRMVLTAEIKAELAATLKHSRTCCEESKDRKHPTPYLPRGAKFMVITENPSKTEVTKGKISEGKGYYEVVAAMEEAGLKRTDAYHTALMKCEKNKGEKMSNQMAIDYGQILDAEIELLKPPVIVALGANAIRHLVPDIKGSWEELAGQSHYDVKRDVTIVFGINPAMLYFDPSRLHHIVNAFEQAADII